MLLEPGTKLGTYEVVTPIGAGGMGEVYRARDTKLGREVAIKILPEEFSRDRERVARFEREAKVLASLNHTNIATLFGLEEWDGRQLLVMELVEGETLAERIARGAIPVDEAVPLFIQVADGLEAAHEKGVTHRDVKPANIKLTPEGKVIILDFGLAKAYLPDENVAVASSQSPRLTKGTALGTIMGTAAYMSPEQARGKPLDKRTDIWAFGCVLFEALVGRPVFGGESITDVLANVVKTEPDWSRLPQTVPWRLRDLLRRCLRKDARRRLVDMSAARFDLEDAADEPEASVSSPQPTRRPRIAAVAFALALGVLAFVLGVWSTVKPTPAEVVRFTIDLPLEQRLSGNYELTNVVAISRDGQRVAYVAQTGGVDRLYLRALNAFEARPVPATGGAGSPFFSPDGKWVGFFADRKLQKVSWNGELPSTIGPVAGFAGGAFWNESEQIIFSDTGLGIFRVPASGGKPELLTSPDFTKGEFSLITPQPLPGRDVLLISIRTYEGERFGLHFLETGERRVLGEGSRAHYVRPAPWVISSIHMKEWRTDARRRHPLRPSDNRRRTQTSLRGTHRSTHALRGLRRGPRRIRVLDGAAERRSGAPAHFRRAQLVRGTSTPSPGRVISVARRRRFVGR